MASMATTTFSPQRDLRVTHLRSDFLPKNHPTKVGLTRKNPSLSIACSLVKTVRSPGLDRHVEKQNKTRFVQKLKTLLLSKPRHFLPLHVASKCRSYLALSTPKSILAMIKRYPTVFKLFTMPWPSLPLHAAKSFPQLCVRLTPAAEAIAARESQHRASVVDDLARKLHRLVMISSHRRLLLSKLVHIAPDLGLPPNFRSRLCNDYPERFKIVDTSYGRALELVSWDADLARAFPARPEGGSRGRGLIVDRPLKFKHLRLRKGLNVKRAHRDFLIKFGELEDVCPYANPASAKTRYSNESAEKRACAVVREVLAMTVEKRTLIDHITHFRKEFGLPNKLRGLIVRHPELFYVSVKGLRDSVMLVECYDDDGELLDKDGSLEIKQMFMKLVRDGKRMRRERKRDWNTPTAVEIPVDEEEEEEETDVDALDDDDYEDGFEHLFEEGSEEFDGGDDTEIEMLSYRNNAEFWTAHHAEPMEPW